MPRSTYQVVDDQPIKHSPPLDEVSAYKYIREIACAHNDVLCGRMIGFSRIYSLGWRLTMEKYGPLLYKLISLTMRAASCLGENMGKEAASIVGNLSAYLERTYIVANTLSSCSQLYESYRKDRALAIISRTLPNLYFEWYHRPGGPYETKTANTLRWVVSCKRPRTNLA